MRELSREEIDAIMKKQTLVCDWFNANVYQYDFGKEALKEHKNEITQHIERIMEKATEQTEIWFLCQMAKRYLEERPHGEWIEERDKRGHLISRKCPFCKVYEEGLVINFCHYCGADMRKEGEAE